MHEASNTSLPAFTPTHLLLECFRYPWIPEQKEEYKIFKSLFFVHCYAVRIGLHCIEGHALVFEKVLRTKYIEMIVSFLFEIFINNAGYCLGE